MAKGSTMSESVSSALLELASLASSQSSTPNVDSSREAAHAIFTLGFDELPAWLKTVLSKLRTQGGAAAGNSKQPQPAAEPKRQSQRQTQQRNAATQAAATEGTAVAGDGSEAAAAQAQMPDSCPADISDAAVAPQTRGRKRGRSPSAGSAAVHRSRRTRIASPEPLSRGQAPSQPAPVTFSTGRQAPGAAKTRTKTTRGSGRRKKNSRARKPATAAVPAHPEAPAADQPPAQQPAIQLADITVAPETQTATVVAAEPLEAPKLRRKRPRTPFLALENEPPSPTHARAHSEASEQLTAAAADSFISGAPSQDIPSGVIVRQPHQLTS